jgi:ribosomal protein S18 acetylase RimI-like enzyme
MKVAKQHAIKKRYRRLVLETQSCNFPAISFYLKCGFELCGFDLAGYSNSDLKNNEVRLEFHYLI